MIHTDWTQVQETGEFELPIPGGYVAVICGIRDDEEKQYLEIRWDFADGAYKGANASTYNRAGFWPTKLFRSYKPKALGMFKAFFTAVEGSNPGYRFNDRDVMALIGKKIGVVLGEEEYQKNSGEIGLRLHVAAVKPVQKILNGDYKVPDPKRISGSQYRTASQSSNFAEYGKEDGDVPF